MRHLDRLDSNTASRLDEIAASQDDVVSVHDLMACGVTRSQMRAKLSSGLWVATGRMGIALHGGALTQRGTWWAALCDAGPRAALDGVTALEAAGLNNFDAETIRISVPRGVPVHRHPGATIRQTRRLQVSDIVSVGIPRVRPEIAAVRAGLWAVTNRQAALVMTMSVQQRLCRPIDLVHALGAVKRDKRLKFLEGVAGAALNGVAALSELDFARLCRDYGIPEPDRQVVRKTKDGTAYLDCYWAQHKVVAEIDGIQHSWAKVVIADARRQNDLVLQGDRVLRFPYLALKIDPAPFMRQLSQALGIPLAS